MNINKNLRNLDNYLIEDYFNLNKNFYPYLWTSAYGLSIMLKKKKSKFFINNYINKVHNILGNNSLTNIPLSLNPNKPKWVNYIPINNILNKNNNLIGGLRIGKAEQGLKDGIYLHYITKWVYILAKTAIKFNNVIYFLQACNIMLSCSEKCRIHKTSNYFKFSRMMNEDLDSPIQISEIFHDPLDTYLTLYFLYINIEFFKKNKKTIKKFNINHVLNSYKKILKIHINEIHNIRVIKYTGANLVNNDQLGIGFLFSCIHRIIQLYKKSRDNNLILLLKKVIDASFKSLKNIKKNSYTTDFNNIYRKCGITIGLRDINLIKLKSIKIDDDLKIKIIELKTHTKELRKKFHNNFKKNYQIWKKNGLKKTDNFAQHKDINIVMYLESKIIY